MIAIVSCKTKREADFVEFEAFKYGLVTDRSGNRVEVICYDPLKLDRVLQRGGVVESLFDNVVIAD